MRAIWFVGLFSVFPVVPSASAQSAHDFEVLAGLYNRLNLTIALPSQSRALGDGNPKIDPVLAPPDGSPISARAITSSEEAVTVLVRSAADLPGVRARITAAGGRVTAEAGRKIYARLSPNSVQAIAALPEVLYVGAQSKFNPPPLPPLSPGAADRGLMSAGLAATHVSLLHQKGIRGSGVKVGILDFGFSGYRELQASGKLPAPKAVRSFGKDGLWDRGKKGTPHGAACAEIIHSMAPDADLYIAAVGDGSGGAYSDETQNAAHWLMEQGVDIISYSGGGQGGAHNGKDDDDDLVEEATRRGILWVVSAGNDGNKHWSADSSATTGQNVMTGKKDFLLVYGIKGEELQIIVNWDDWGDNPKEPHSNQVFAGVLNLVNIADGAANTSYVIHSSSRRNGAPRFALKTTPKEDGLYAVFIVPQQVTRRVRVHAYVSGGILYPFTPVGSIAIPATSPYALSVGAVNVDSSQLESFSSQGPTDDGRAKPEVAAPDRVFSDAYGKEFPGTSAACPFVSGFAALVRQMRGKVAPAELIRIIAASTTPLNNNAGAGGGMIDAAKLPGMGPGSGNPPRTNPPSSNPAPPRPSPAPSPSLAGRILPLLQLARADNPLGVKIVTGHSEYRVGDGMKIGFRAQQDAHCLVVRKTGASNVTIVQPAAGGELHLAAGAAAVFPAAPAQTIRLTAPGTEEVGLICSASPINPELAGRADPQSLSVAVATYQIQ